MACSFLGQFLENIKEKDNMASDNKATVQVSTGFFNILFFILLILKLTGNFDYSWWLVFLPLYGPLLFLLFVGIIFFICFLLYAVFDDYKAKKKAIKKIKQTKTERRIVED